MKRTILAGMAVAALLLSSCAKDFTADIEDLQSQINDIKTKVDAIQSAAAAGIAVSSVEKTDNGIIIRMSDGNDYSISNGADGAPGSLVAVNDAGNWTIDGVDTGLAARGRDGIDGKDGADGDKGSDGINGVDGKNGADGKNGDYYVPCTDKSSDDFGKWIKVDGQTGKKTVTTDRWNVTSQSSGSEAPEGAITAIWDEGSLLVFGVEGYESEDGYMEINLTSLLRGLMVYPEEWSTSFGLPSVTSYYVITPLLVSVIMTGNLDNPRLKGFNWPGGITESVSCNNSEYVWFGKFLLGIAYATYLGMTDQKDDPDYNPEYDANSASFMWQWIKIENGLEDPADIRDAVQALAAYVGECLAAAESSALIEQAVVSTPVTVKYRVMPVGASLEGYKYNFLDHGVKMTKAGEENRGSAIAVSGTPRYKRDELTVEATTNFLKAQSCTPVEFLKKYLKYNQYDDGSGYFAASNKYINEVTPKYFEAEGLAQGLIFNLEASTNGKGASAIVSNECLLNFEPFEPYIYYKDADFNYVPLAFTDAPGDSHSQTAVAGFNESLNLNKIFMLRDQKIGTAEKVGFEVSWEYAVSESAADVLEVVDGVLRLQNGAKMNQLEELFYVDVTARIFTPSNGGYIPVSAGRYYLQVSE